MMNPDEFLRVYADQLELEHGPCLQGRAVLLDWLDQLIDRLSHLQAPGHAAMDMISSEYMLWQLESLGLDPDDGT